MSKMWVYPCRKLNSTTKSSATLEFSVRVFWPTLFSQRFTRLSSTSRNHLTLLVAFKAHRIRIKRLKHSSQQRMCKSKWAWFNLTIICYPMKRIIWIPVKDPRSQTNRGDRGLWSGRPVVGGHARRQIRGSEDDERPQARHSGTEPLVNESRPIRYICVLWREIPQSAKSKHG